jgi:hypothetical protein
LLQMLNKIQGAGLMKGLIELHKRQILRPKIDHALCKRALDYLETSKIDDTDLFSVKVKLLEPVFAGSVIKYHCQMESDEPESYSVDALVDERVVAKGIISQSFGLTS